MNTTPELWTAPSGERPWRTAYQRFRELERWLTDEHPSGRVPCAAPRRGRRATRFRSQGIARLRSSYDQNAPGFVFEDVYHLAFHQIMSWRSYGAPILPAADYFRLYRGQRKDTWEVGAKIYRGLPDGPGRYVALRPRAAGACQIGHAIARRLGLSFMNAMAIAQHYSAADLLGVPTWLVDLSRDPWVALFFASDGGETGDFGIVWDIIVNEYIGHTVGAANPVGSLQLVVPDAVPRIDNQAGVFVVAGLPQIFDQYVAFGRDTRFRQHDGLRFEDPLLGISAHSIYPPDDPLRDVLAEALAEVTDCGCGPASRPCAVPSAVFTDPFYPKTYEVLLTCWLNEFPAERPGDSKLLKLRAALVDLARFHARLHSPAYVGRLPNIVSRSLNGLRDAFEALYFQALRGEPVSVRDAVRKSYVNHVLWDEGHVAVLSEALNQTPPCSDALRSG